MKTAKAAVMTGINEPFKIREYELTPPPAGMAKIKLIASGICGTDNHIHKGKILIHTPAIIGHEFIGQVIELSNEDSYKYDILPGDNVIVYIACPCGECLLCRNGDDANCINMGVTNSGDPDNAPHFFGGYAEYNYSPVKNLVKIPKNLDPKTVCVFACAGPTGLHAFRLTKQAGYYPKSTDLAVVQGLGPVGVFSVMYLASIGIKNIVAVTKRDNLKREKTARLLGATEVYSIDRTGINEIINNIANLTGGIGADIVIEASGNPDAVEQGLNLLRNRGVYLIPGQYSNSGKVEISPQLITFKALQIIGSSQYSISDIKDYIDFLQKNPQLHCTILSLACQYSVDNVNCAIEDCKSGKNIKTMLVNT